MEINEESKIKRLKDPALLVMNHIRYSYDLIKKNGQLAINVPGEELLEETYFVGTVSGRNTDKFKKSGLTQFLPNLSNHL